MIEQAARNIDPIPPPVQPADALLAGQKNVLEMIVRGQSLTAVLEALCNIVETQATRPVRAAILLVGHDAKRLWTAAAPSLPQSYSRAVDGIAIAPDVGTCCAAAARREPIVTRDIATDPAWAQLSHLPLGLGLKAAWSMPIFSSSGTVLGTFGTYFPETREPLPHERQLVEVLSHTAALAIERQRADEALNASEARYRAMVEANPECVKLVAADGTLLQMNAAGLRMVGADKEFQVAGRSIYDVIAPEHREKFRAFNEQVCRGSGGTLEFDIIGLNGVRRSMESTAVPLPHSGGGFSQLAVTRDVTARVAAQHALTESRARLDYAVRLSGVGFWYCDLPLSELVWDARVKEHFFFLPDARITVDDFYARIHPEDRAHTRAAIESSTHNGTSYDVVYRTVHPDSGETKWIRALGGTACAADGTPTRFDGVTVDVSEQKFDEQHMAALNQRLLEQDQRKDEFLATLAHELRNPLAPVRTGLEILRIGGNPEQSAKVREMMERQLGHLVRMVDDLLDISRVTLGKVTLKKERIDFRAVLHSALETTRPLVEAAGHELAVRLPQDPFPLEADATRLTQVIANLINNAAKYTPAGGRIQLTAATGGATLTIKVSDTGIGIPPDMLPRVFDMFTQVGRSIEQSQGGLGIGLTLVRRLVEMHGGTVEAESPGPGQGSTFIVKLPLANSHSAPDSPNIDERINPQNALRILVVDDNVDAAQSLALLLDLSGHQTRLAHSGPEALAIAAEFNPDALLLDIGLPGLNGYEVARQLRTDNTIRRPLLLMALTGWGTDEDRRKAHAAGFDTHLVKPVNFDKLMKALDDWQKQVCAI